MRAALEEARAYTAIHEVKVSKGRQTLDIAKDDLPVYKAKGWKLTEGTMQGGIIKYAGQSSSEYNKAKAAYKQFMSKPQPAKNAEDNVMPFIFDDELLDDLYVASKKNVSDVRPIVKKRLNALGIKEEATETLDEFKKMVVTIKDPIKRNQAMQDIQRFGKSFEQLTKETVRSFLIDSKKSKFKI